ncbi:MAG: hypothetical protein ACRDHY_14435, partial [Anaerolineales bacterium]
TSRGAKTGGKFGLSPAGVSFESRFVRDRAARVHAVKGKGYFKLAVRWILTAQKWGYDALVLVLDQDRRPGRRAEVNRAQDYEGSPLPRALGVAIEAFDAWILADEEALAQVLGFPVERQPDPEKLPDPKAVCTHLLQQGGCSLSQSQMYAEVARRVDFKTLEDRCRRGFAPFAERLRRLRS